jgi:hypothetical protein
LEKIPDLVSSIVGGIISCVGKFVEAGAKLLEGVWEGIKGAAGWLWEQISGFFGGIVDDIVALFTGGKMKGLGKGIAEDLNEGYDSYLDSKAPETASPSMNIYDTAQVGATVNGIYPASADQYARSNLTGAGGRYERMDEVIDMLGIIANNPVVVAIGDDQIGVANNTYESRRGAIVQEGAYANAS